MKVFIRGQFEKFLCQKVDVAQRVYTNSLIQNNPKPRQKSALTQTKNTNISKKIFNKLCNEKGFINYSAQDTLSKNMAPIDTVKGQI
tara:strand:+ start:2539 stop:2799 length:261 start_codon:yes stop_codon:yes gene_type:complete